MSHASARGVCATVFVVLFGIVLFSGIAHAFINAKATIVGNQIQITWTDSKNTAVQYLITETAAGLEDVPNPAGHTNCSDKELKKVPASTKTFMVNGVPKGGGLLAFGVYGLDASLNKIPNYKGYALLKIPYDLPLVENGKAKANGASMIDVTWQYDAKYNAKFRINRSEQAKPGNYMGPSKPHATVGPNVTQFHDQGLLPNTIYQYCIYAFNSTGRSDYSCDHSTIQATTGSVPKNTNKQYHKIPKDGSPVPGKPLP
jgi:hypothetical protein